jgi:hypothetical protein
VSGTQLYWSVTTIISAGVPKPALAPWQGRETARYAVYEREAWLPLAERDPEAAVALLKGAPFRQARRAALRGSQVHAAAERLNLGQPPDVADEVLPYVEQYARFLAEHRPRLLMAEAPVFSREWAYAGTLDAIVELDGLPYVLDIKTTDKTDDEKLRPPYPEVALQLVAYRRADLVSLTPAVKREHQGRRYYVLTDESQAEPMPATAGALALAISPVDYRLVPARTDDEVWECWLHVREVARWTLDVSRHVLGPPVSPSREQVLTAAHTPSASLSPDGSRLEETGRYDPETAEIPF